MKRLCEGTEAYDSAECYIHAIKYCKIMDLDEPYVTAVCLKHFKDLVRDSKHLKELTEEEFEVWRICGEVMES